MKKFSEFMSMKELPDVIDSQEFNGYCGPACWQHILKMAGKRISQHELAKISRCTQKNGADHDGMLAIGKKFEIDCWLEKNISFDELQSNLNKGYFVIVDYTLDADDSPQSEHYSLLESVNDKFVMLNDPSYPPMIASI